MTGLASGKSMNFEVRVEGLEGPDLRTRGRRWPRHQVSASQGRDKTLGDEEACWQQMLGFGTEASQTGPDVFVRCASIVGGAARVNAVVTVLSQPKCPPSGVYLSLCRTSGPRGGYTKAVTAKTATVQWAVNSAQRKERVRAIGCQGPGQGAGLRRGSCSLSVEVAV